MSLLAWYKIIPIVPYSIIYRDTSIPCCIKHTQIRQIGLLTRSKQWMQVTRNQCVLSHKIQNNQLTNNTWNAEIQDCRKWSEDKYITSNSTLLPIGRFGTRLPSSTNCTASFKTPPHPPALPLLKKTLHKKQKFVENNTENAEICIFFINGKMERY